MAIDKLTYGRVTWLNIVNATPQDVEVLLELMPYLHPLNLEDMVSLTERPKVDVDDDYLYIVMHFPYWDAKQALSRPKEVDFIIGRGVVVTAHDDCLKPLVNLFNMCKNNEEMRARIMGRGANHTFYTILDSLVDYIRPILRKVDLNIRNIEETIFEEDTRVTVQRISLLRRDIIALRRIIRQQVPIVEQLESGEYPIIHEDLEAYFGDIADHLYRERDIIDEDYEIINGLADTVNTLASHRINEAMRVLTVISVIILPLTLISSIYGMNIPLPFQPEYHGEAEPFLILSALMVVVGIAMLVYFKRRHWI